MSRVTALPLQGELGGGLLEYLVIEKQQLFLRSGEEHPRDVLCTLVVRYAQQLTRPLQVLLLRQLCPTAEHQVIALCGRPFQHQQTKLVLFRQHQFGNLTQPFLLSGGYLLFPFMGKRGRGPVDVHTHRRAYTSGAFQRTILVG